MGFYGSLYKLTCKAWPVGWASSHWWSPRPQQARLVGPRWGSRRWWWTQIAGWWHWGAHQGLRTRGSPRGRGWGWRWTTRSLSPGVNQLLQFKVNNQPIWTSQMVQWHQEKWNLPTQYFYMNSSQHTECSAQQLRFKLLSHCCPH